MFYWVKFCKVSFIKQISHLFVQLLYPSCVKFLGSPGLGLPFTSDLNVETVPSIPYM